MSLSCSLCLGPDWAPCHAPRNLCNYGGLAESRPCLCPVHLTLPTTMPVPRAPDPHSLPGDTFSLSHPRNPGPGLRGRGSDPADSSTWDPPCLGAPAEVQAWQGAPQGLSPLHSPLPWAPPEHSHQPRLTPNLLPCAGSPAALRARPSPSRALRPHPREPGPPGSCHSVPGSCWHRCAGAARERLLAAQAPGAGPRLAPISTHLPQTGPAPGAAQRR